MPKINQTVRGCTFAIVLPMVAKSQLQTVREEFRLITTDITSHRCDFEYRERDAGRQIRVDGVKIAAHVNQADAVLAWRHVERIAEKLLTIGEQPIVFAMDGDQLITFEVAEHD